MTGLTLTCLSRTWLKMLLCLMQETTLQNIMIYYSHTIITENQTNYATFCLLVTFKKNMFWLNIWNIQCTCSEAAQQLHHTSHPTESNSERNKEASRVNALLKGTLTDLPPGKKTWNRTLQDPSHSSPIAVPQPFKTPSTVSPKEKKYIYCIY